MTSRSQSSGLSLSRLKPPPLGSTSSSRWMVLASNPGGFGHALGGTARRGAQRQAHALGGEDAQDRVDDGRLAHTGSAGDDEDLRHEGEPDRGHLTVGQRQAGLLLDPRQRLLRVDVGPGQRSIDQAQYPLGDDLLGPVQAGEEDAGRLADRVGDDRSLGQFEIQRRLDQLRRGPRASRRQAAPVPRWASRSGPRPSLRSARRRCRRARGSSPSCRCRASWRSHRRS